MAVLPPDPVFCLKSDMGHIHSLCFPITNENYSSRLLAATESGFVYFWDLETNRLQHKQPMGDSIQAIHSISHDIITQEKIGMVKLWTITNSSYQLSKTYSCRGGYCRSILLNDNLIVPQEDSTLDIIHISTMSKLARLVPHKPKLGNVMCLQKVELGGKIYILGGYETGDIILWDYTTAQPCGHLKLRECITSLTFDPVTGRGICGNASNTLQIFTIDKNFNITLKCEISITNEGCNIVKLRDDRKIFVAGNWDGSLRMFSWKSLRLLVVLNEHKGAVTDVQFSVKPVRFWDANIMAASGADGVISLWNLYN
ncbi:guanine nucleotide-binding protein subunit beta-like protein 1 [Tribolium madens]|uniref:guanine nucleotide-binding protein subunit beta-like protein 1 n=1 Tax=Tribolium madens TaxID=41895 RepID=UPI001CF7564A|nr:guanine nucleotide-binding protein subunit beta-like protein 1 [Tribolium madens]